MLKQYTGCMNIRIISEPISRPEALEIGKEFYPHVVKGVVDTKKEIIALGGEYHMDANTVLTEAGSSQADVWGFNIYPNQRGDDWIEYTSLINIRPAANNRTMTVEDEDIRKEMKRIIEKLIAWTLSEQQVF